MANKQDVMFEIQRNLERFYDPNISKDQGELIWLWISLLSRLLRDMNITYAQMMMLVQEGIMEEHEFSALLKSHNDKRDFEWYSEDFMGCDLNDDTMLTAAEITEIVEERFKDKIRPQI